MERFNGMDDFAEFVAARSAALLRTAWLLTGDDRAAEDLLQTALAAAWRRWRRVAAGPTRRRTCARSCSPRI
ncbi:hypothetical protein ACPPVO_12385 [Dactylosporangium sp. McL0621]|uniref:hypothetical protein n=1 Tax=Dactylosporangium sp. McL0621 TaxID=3415678 RepID=UPI003CF20CC5